MEDSSQTDTPAAIWARRDAFPPAPQGWGWMDAKGRRTVCGSAEELIAAIREDRHADVTLVWTPDFSHMVVPEEVREAEEAVATARKRRAGDDYHDALDRVKRFSLLLSALALYMLWQGWHLTNNQLLNGN